MRVSQFRHVGTARLNTTNYSIQPTAQLCFELESIQKKRCVNAVSKLKRRHREMSAMFINFAYDFADTTR